MCFTVTYGSGRQWKQCYKVTTENYTLIGLHLKTQRTTGNNSGKINMQIGSSRGNYIGMCN